MQSGIINIYLLMALIGYATFVFVGESVNPLRPPRNINATGSRRRLRRYWLGVIAGLLVAASALIVKIFPVTGLIGQLKVSLLTALVLLLPLLVYVIRVEHKQKLSGMGIKKTGHGNAVSGANNSPDHRPPGDRRQANRARAIAEVELRLTETSTTVASTGPATVPVAAHSVMQFEETSATGQFAEDNDADTRYADTRYTDSQYTDSQYTDSQYTDSQYSDSQYSDSQYSDTQYADTQYSEPNLNLNSDQFDALHEESLIGDQTLIGDENSVSATVYADDLTSSTDIKQQHVISELQDRLDSKEAEIQRLQSRLDDSVREAREFEARAAREEVVQQELRNKEQQALALMAENEKIGPLQSELAALRNVSTAAQDSEAEVRLLRSNLSQSEQRASALLAENEDLSDRLDDSIDAINKQTEKSVEDLEAFSDLQQKVMDKENGLAVLEKNQLQNQTRLQQYENQLLESRELIEQLQARLNEADQWKTETSKAHANIASLNSQVSDLKQQSSDEISALHEQVSQLDRELQSSLHTQQELQQQLSVRDAELAKQLQLLDKNRDIARNATIAARRAAVAHKSAKDVAMRERQSRIKMELSAKKAVNIARDAIGKLSVHENRLQ